MKLVPTSATRPPPILRLPPELVVEIMSYLLLFDDDNIHLCYTGNFYLGFAFHIRKNALAILRTCRTIHRVGSAFFFQRNVFIMCEPSCQFKLRLRRRDAFEPHFCPSPLKSKHLRTIRHMVILRLSIHRNDWLRMTRYDYKASFAVEALAALGASLDSLSIVLNHNQAFELDHRGVPRELWEMDSDWLLYSYASQVIPALGRLLFLRRTKTLRFISCDGNKDIFHNYQLNARWAAETLSSLQLADWGRTESRLPSPPKSSERYGKCAVIEIAADNSGFTITRSCWNLHCPPEMWRRWRRCVTRGHEPAPPYSVSKRALETEQFPRARLRFVLTKLIFRLDCEYSVDEEYELDLVDFRKIRDLLGEWEWNPHQLVDLPPPTDDLMKEAVGDQCEAWRSALAAAKEEKLCPTLFIRWLCLAISNDHLIEVRPGDLGWLVEAQKGREFYTEARRDPCCMDRIPPYYLESIPEDWDQPGRKSQEPLPEMVRSKAQTKITDYFKPVLFRWHGSKAGGVTWLVPISPPFVDHQYHPIGPDQPPPHRAFKTPAPHWPRHFASSLSSWDRRFLR